MAILAIFWFLKLCIRSMCGYKVFTAPFYVRSKDCTFSPHLEGSNADFTPHMERSNEDFALHMEGRHVDFATHMEWRHRAQ